jgi:hypothetical protein
MQRTCKQLSSHSAQVLGVALVETSVIVSPLLLV